MWSSGWWLSPHFCGRWFLGENGPGEWGVLSSTHACRVTVCTLSRPCAPRASSPSEQEMASL